LDYKRNLNSELSREDQKESNEDFVGQMVKYWENNILNVFKRPKDVKIADSVVELFRRKESIDNFNKKALYILIREMTGLKTQHITRVIGVMKKYNTKLIKEYYSSGSIDTRNTGSLFIEE
jgi:hypothetical protein